MKKIISAILVGLSMCTVIGTAVSANTVKDTKTFIIQPLGGPGEKPGVEED